MNDKAFLSIVRWPDGTPDPRRVEDLVAAAGLEPFLATQRVRRGTPLIAALIDTAVRDEVLRELHRRGVLAFAPSRAELAAAPQPIRAKRLLRPQGAPDGMLMVEPWRGSPEGLLPDQPFLIVRARLDQSTTRTIIGSDPNLTATPSWGGITGAGAVGTGVDYSIGDLTPTTQRSSSQSSRHVLDLFTRDGRRIRCDSDKFNFDILGKARGLTDFENSRKLAELFTSLYPKAAIDEGFPTLRTSSEILTSFSRTAGDATISKRDDTPAFEFYSAWSYCLHQAGLA